MDMALAALTLGLAGAALIVLGILMIILSRTQRDSEGEEDRAYGVLLIGPLPIIIRGRGSAVWLMIAVLLVLALIIAIMVITAI